MKVLKNNLMKITKMFLVALMIFSQTSGTIRVLAEELALTSEETKATNYEIDADLNDYTLTFKAINSEENASSYVDDQDYNVKVTSTFTYMDDTTKEEVYDKTSDDVVGEIIQGSQLKLDNTYELGKIEESYNGTYTVKIEIYEMKDGKVVEGSSPLFTKEFEVKTINSFEYGLKIDENPTNLEKVGDDISENGNITATYKVSNLEENTSLSLKLNTGNLNPSKKYILDYENILEENKTAKSVSELSLFTIELLKDKSFKDELHGNYEYTGEITLTEEDNPSNVITYSYNIIIENGNSSDNDNALSENNLGIDFYEKFAIFDGKLTEEELQSLPKVEDLLKELQAKGYNVVVKNGEEEVETGNLTTGMVIEISSESKVLDYNVVILPDTNSDALLDIKDIEAIIDRLIDFNSNELAFEEVYELMLGDIIPKEDLYRNLVMYLYKSINEEEWIDPEDYQTEITDEIQTSLENTDSLIRTGDFFDVTLNLNGLDEDYLNMIEGLIKYDKEFLKLVTVTSNYDWVGNTNLNTLGSNKLMYIGENADKDGVLLTFTFEALKETSNTTIEFTDSKYNKDFEVLEKEDLTLDLSIKRALHTNSDLASLKSNVGYFDKNFDADIMEYTLYVDSHVTNVSLDGTVADEYAKVSGFKTYNLTGDNTKISIVVTAENGNNKTYVVNVVKVYKSTNNYLSSLIIEGYDISFDKDVLEYNIKVGNDVTALDLTAIADSNSATVVIEGNEDFKEGLNVVTITVTAEDGSVKTYTINVEKEKAKSKINDVVDDEEEITDNNKVEKIVIVVLIILVVLGLLYLIFKKDEEEQNQKLKELKKNK